jgi:hypothetical protein
MFGFPLRVGVRVGGVGVCRVKVLVRVRVKVRFGVLLKFLPIAPPHTETKGATKRFQKKGSRTSQSKIAVWTGGPAQAYTKI